MKTAFKRKRTDHSSSKKGKGNSTKVSFENEDEEIQELLERIQNEAPEPGTQPVRRTLYGLSSSKMEIATEIQAAAIPHALAGRDILGAAKTGSGKTLAFVIPMLEKLFREKWTSSDGLAAIIISPTRELAFQIFEVMRTVGKKHSFSAGLITGGKKEFFGEQQRIVGMNILVATPGRLLQHFEQTSGLDASQLLFLILDEADRILDMGFRAQIDSILSYLPQQRQTLLFSATQTKSIKELARLSLSHPEYVAVHAHDEEVTPKQLIQNYIVTPLPHKLDILFSFIKSHLKSKMIVFFSTCAQARYVYECFRSMQPGTVLMALHGKVKQDRRTIIYNDFLKRPAACLLATDIAARGLDFPNVDWVVQADAPEDAAMYIHRVGRTARYNAGGKALLILMPHEEEPVIKVLTESAVPIKKLTVNPKRTYSVAASAAALLAAHPDYRNYAKKAFLSYLRSLQLLTAYPVKDLRSLPVEEFANALGLPMMPELPKMEVQEVDQARDEVRKKKNVNRTLDKLKKQIQAAKEAKRLKREAKFLEKQQSKQPGDSDTSDLSSSDDSDDDSDDSDGTKTDHSSDNEEQPNKNKAKGNKFSVHQMKIEIEKKREEAAKQKLSATGRKEESDEEDDFLQVKRVHRWDEDNEVLEDNNQSKNDNTATTSISKVDPPKKLKITKEGKLKTMSAKKYIFDDEGNAMTTEPKLVSIDEKAAKEIAERVEKHTSSLKEKLDAVREEDHLRDKQRIREKKLQQKQKMKLQKELETGANGGIATLAAPVEEYDMEVDEEDEEESTNDQQSDGEYYSISENSEEDSQEEEEHIPKKKKRSNLSIQDQEQLALQLLNNRK